VIEASMTEFLWLKLYKNEMNKTRTRKQFMIELIAIERTILEWSMTSLKPVKKLKPNEQKLIKPICTWTQW